MVWLTGGYTLTRQMMCFLEFDTDGDGKPDRRVLRSGRRLAFNGTSWREVTSTVCNGSE